MCDPIGISAAWIDPVGVVFDLKQMEMDRAAAGEEILPQDHEEWAQLFIGRDSKDAIEELVQAGWIKVSNATSIDATNPTDGSRRAFAQMLAKCVGDGHIDPFEEIYVWTGSGSWTPQAADLVEAWGDRAMSDAMFARLNAKLREARTLRTLRGLVRALLT